jgi:hypothetical protein
MFQKQSGDLVAPDMREGIGGNEGDDEDEC